MAYTSTCYFDRSIRGGFSGFARTDVKLPMKVWKESDHKLPINKIDTDSIILGRLRDRDLHDRGLFLKEAPPYKPPAIPP